MYHPAAALHQPRLRTDLDADMKKLPKLLGEVQVQEIEEAKPPEQPPQQLSLF